MISSTWHRSDFSRSYQFYVIQKIPARKFLGYYCPFVADLVMLMVELLLFLQCPLCSHQRINMLAVSKMRMKKPVPALLGIPGQIVLFGQRPGDHAPLFNILFLVKITYYLILFLSERSIIPHFNIIKGK